MPPQKELNECRAVSTGFARACGEVLRRGYAMTSAEVGALSVAYGFRQGAPSRAAIEDSAAQRYLRSSGLELQKLKHRGRSVYIDKAAPAEDVEPSLAQAVAEIDQELDELTAARSPRGEDLTYVAEGHSAFAPFSLVIDGGPPQFKPASKAYQEFTDGIQEMLDEQKERKLGRRFEKLYAHGGIGRMARLLLTGESDLTPHDRQMVEPIAGHGITFHDPNFDRIQTPSGSGSLARRGLQDIVHFISEPDISAINYNLSWFNNPAYFK